MRNVLLSVLNFIFPSIIVLVLWLAAIAVIVFLADNAAQGQNTINNQPVIRSFNEHPQHADARELPTGGGTAVVSGDSNSNVPAPPEAEPLGTSARRLKAEHDVAPKAKVVYVN